MEKAYMEQLKGLAFPPGMLHVSVRDKVLHLCSKNATMSCDSFGLEKKTVFNTSWYCDDGLMAELKQKPAHDTNMKSIPAHKFIL